MFIVKDYTIDLEAPGCAPGSENWNATARFDYDISEVFPYLNAVWPRAIYSHEGRMLACKIEGRAVALKPHEITIGGIPDRDVATVELEKLIAEINRIWMAREQITPRTAARKRLVAMEIYKLLPQTNCKLCGQASCFSFAGQLTVGAAKLEACTPLSDSEQFTSQRQELGAMLANAAS